VIRLGNGQPTVHGSIPGCGKDVPLVRSVQNVSGVHPSCPAEGGGWGWDSSSKYGRGCEVQVERHWRYSYMLGEVVRIGLN